MLPLITFAIILCSALLAMRARAKRKSLPPGPRGLPIVGNFFDIPDARESLIYRDMAAQHGARSRCVFPRDTQPLASTGDVFALHSLGRTIIVLSSREAASDLLEKRSAIYSDRPRSVLAHMTGWENNLAFMPYGETWRRVRRVMWREFQPSAALKYRAAQQREARRFLRHLLHETADLTSHARLAIAAMILTSIHGLPIEEVTHHFVDLLTNANSGIARIFSPAPFLVESLQWLRHVPAWFPGAGWQRRVASWKEQRREATETPYAAAKAAMHRPDATRSMIGELLDKTRTLPSEDYRLQEEELVKGIVATSFIAGTDTSSATLLAFFAAMIMFPQVQKRAQEELDTVVGLDRLPEHADRPSLPYVSAVVQETLRWHTVEPLGLPHCCMEEDEYRGWRIPKGAVVVPHVWSMLHDPKVYPDPEVFRPERYLRGGKLDQDAIDGVNVMFGFGRRFCPGKYFASDSLFITLASVLHVFDILPARDASGRPIPVEAKQSPGFFSYVEKFDCSIRPRSKAAEALIRSGMD
ncbi:O-methylsterigmatocystin oxidoreductase [Trametes elegans]|nr:O-methylsterigmatocystin oxidoreductase [Trametes elegans]